MAEVPIDCDFPVWGLLPKKETGVVSFLNKYPSYDGRDTVIAIFDSGVDPAAAGLKSTSTGDTKVIERFDCSGAGDVDTSKIATVNDDRTVTGITGRKLKIPEDWVNPSGSYRVGVLYPFSIYPTKVKERIQDYRKENLWDAHHKPAIAKATKQLQEFEASSGSRGASLSNEEREQKEEYEAQLEVLQTLDKKYQDLGPTYDCVLYNDGSVWRACIDTSETGDLSTGPHLGEYSKTHEHVHLTAQDEMTVSINVHDEGNTLEVVGMCSAHGTHVAAIAAGYFPDEPDKNGVAPGAKIVSLTIGDSRLGSMETGTALVRACIKVMELCKTLNISVVNMSYGEHAHFAHRGRVGEMISSVVTAYGVSWVVSAGNHGPALCTVGAPPDIQQPILIGVGAYVSPEMTAAAYSLRTRVGAGAFSWSSRGPAADGAMCVSLCAPGAAVASVARFTLRHSQLMNGTSMAAPHVAGAVAALISGLKAKNIRYTPFSIKRYLENSATYVPSIEPWAQGCGLLNVEKAFEMMTTYKSQPEDDITFKVSCGNSGAKGIFLRLAEDDVARDVAVTIEPQFLRDAADREDRGTMARQIAFSAKLALLSSATWVSAPAHLHVMNAARPIAVRVDAARLPPGPHFASINAYDVSNVEKGPVFRVAVTVFQPQPLPPPYTLSEPGVLFTPGAIRRHIVLPPLDATWCVVRLRTAERGAAARFLVHVLQLLPRRSCRASDTHKMLSVAGDAPAALAARLQGGVHVEIAIAKYWANLGDIQIDYSVEFCGVRPDCGPRLVLSADSGPRQVALRTLRAGDVSPQPTLRHCCLVCRPTESKIHTLTARDVIPHNRQIYSLINTYTFHVAKATDVTPIVPGLSDMLYESELESQMWMIYNSSKQLMGVGDAYPNKVKKKNVVQPRKRKGRKSRSGCDVDVDFGTEMNDSDTEGHSDFVVLSKYSVKLEKGDYTVRLCLRHDSRALLERFAEHALSVTQRLPAPLPLDVYGDQAAALTGGKKLSTTAAAAGALLPVYVAGLPADKVPRAALAVGATLSGSITFAKDELGRKVDSYPLVYIPCEAPRRASRPASSAPAAACDEYSDAARDFHTSWLPKLEGEKLEALYEEVQRKYPEHLGAHAAYLAALDPLTDLARLPSLEEGEEETNTALYEKIITISDKVIDAIDQDKLLAHLGMKNDLRTDANKIKQELEKQRGWLVEALAHRGGALCRLQRPAAARSDNLAATLRHADIGDTKVIQYGIWHYGSLGAWGRAARLLLRLQDERCGAAIDSRLAAAFRRLHWTHLATAVERAAPAKFPHAFRPF